MDSLEQIIEFKTSPELISKLREHSVVKTYTAGDLILDENSAIRAIPIVTIGTLKVMRTEEDGREILLYYITTGESCIMSFLGGMHDEKSKVKAEVEDDAEIMFLPMEKVHLFIKEHPEWLDYIFGFTINVLRNCSGLSTQSLSGKWTKDFLRCYKKKWRLQEVKHSALPMSSLPMNWEPQG